MTKESFDTQEMEQECKNYAHAVEAIEAIIENNGNNPYFFLIDDIVDQIYETDGERYFLTATEEEIWDSVNENRKELDS